jgi:hypothetical protein
MTNGKKGDHPLTDIVLHHLSTFSPTADALIKEIVSLGAQKELEANFDLFSPPPLETFEVQLRNMRDNLKRERKNRGWEV